MDLNNVPSNTFTAREQRKAEEQKKIELVVSKPATAKKPNKAVKFVKDFLPTDIPQTTKDIREKVVVPAIKKTILNAIGTFFGVNITAGGTGATGFGTKVGYTPYSSLSSQKKETITTKATNFDYDELVWEDASDAQRVLNCMMEWLDHYPFIRVSDYYQMATDIVPPYTAEKYGWSSLTNAKVIVKGNGYGIDLPRPMPID